MHDLSRLNEIPDPLAAALLEPRASVRSTALRRPSADRAELRRRRLRTLVVCISWWSGQLALWGLRPDLADLSLAYLLLLVALPALVAAACAYAALSPGPLGLGASRTLLISLSAGSPLAFGVLAFTAPAPDATAAVHSSLHAGLVCVGLLIGWMSVPLLGATRALQGAFAAGTAWRSALAALSVGLCAAATLTLHCSNPSPTHIAIAHGAPLVFAALVGASLLTRWLRS
ncbi:MAG: hypothetical protein RL033_2577 [Pseudomonadota bacterium]